MFKTLLGKIKSESGMNFCYSWICHDGEVDACALCQNEIQTAVFGYPEKSCVWKVVIQTSFHCLRD